MPVQQCDGSLGDEDFGDTSSLIHSSPLFLASHTERP